MKNAIHRTGIVVLLMLMIGSVQAGNWSNISNFQRINDVVVQGNQVWVAASGGLLVYDKVTGKKTFFIKGVNQLPTLSIERVAIHPLTQSVWIGTYDNGIARKDGGNWITYPLPVEDALLYEMKIADNGIIWCATSRGIFSFANGVYTSYLANPLSSNAACWDIDFLTNGKLLCGGHQPFIYDPATDSIENITSTAFAYGKSSVYVQDDSTYYFAGDHGEVAKFINNVEVDTVHVNTLLTDMKTGSNGSLIAMSSQYVLMEFNGTSFDTLAFGNGDVTAFDISGSDIWAAGAITGAGVLKHKDANNITEQIDLRKSGLDGNWVQDVRRMHDGNILVTGNETIQKFDITANAFTQSWSPPVNNTAGISMELNGKLYVGTSYKNMYEYANGQWQQLGENILPHPSVDELTSDKDGNVWLGGPGYVAKYDGTDFTIFNHVNAPAITDNLYIRDIHCDSTRNTVWIATYDGIIKYANGVFTLLNDSTTPGIQQYYDAVETIEEDADHNIWFGTVYGAVLKYDGTDFSTMILPVHRGSQFVSDIKFIDGIMYVSDNLNGVWVYENNSWDSLNVGNSPLSSNFVNVMEVDGQGNLWIGGLDFGIDVYNKNGHDITKVTEANSLEAKVYPNPSTGRFTIQTQGTTDGMVYIHTITGALIQQALLVKGLVTVELDGQPAGLYFATVTTAAGSRVVKLVVQ